MKTLRISLNCDFSDKNLVSEFYKFFEESRNTLNFLKHNKRVFETCNAANRDSCYLPRLYRSVCPHFPLRIAKVVRLKKPSRAESLFESDEFRLIALFRDPRAVASSRAATFYKSDGLKGDEDAFCSDFLTSIDDAVELKRRFPRRVFILRYEDLALDPQSIASDLLNFLDLPMDQSIIEFIASHTKSGAGKRFQYGTRRDSAAAAFAWRDQMDPGDVATVQRLCYESIVKLGYKTLPLNLDDGDQNLLLPFTLNNV